MAGYLAAQDAETVDRGRTLRFERVGLTSAFGNPQSPSTWSGAPFRLASALARRGVSVQGFQPRLGRIKRLVFAADRIASGFGWMSTSEQLLRGARTRNHYANQIAMFAARHGIRDILHTGTLDMPAFDLLRGVRHYLYCDHTWSLSLRFRLDAARLNEKALLEYERLERESFTGLEHIFTFGAYVRDEIIRHYGVPADRVTAVGSGMGEIVPYLGPKFYTVPRLLFIAKHLFKAKGGELLIDAFFQAQKQRPDLTLTIVGDRCSRKYVPRDPRISFLGHVPWGELQRLYRHATLLVQPMLNDPWGQVFLEALISRTPVIGLNRNGLPEIVEHGCHGFLVDHASSSDLANVIVAALRDPDHLAAMGHSGQRHVMNSYSWDLVAERVAFV